MKSFYPIKTIKLSALLLILSIGIWAKAQVANGCNASQMGIDGDLYSNSSEFGNIKNLNPNHTDDWFHQSGGDGIGIIDESETTNWSNPTLITSNPGLEAPMSIPKNSLIHNYRLMEGSYLTDDYGGAGSTDLSAYTSAAKNGEPLDSWPTGASNINAKTDIIDSYMHLRRDENGTPPEFWLYGGVSRVSNSGQSYFDMELFARDVTYTPGVGFSSAGPDGGHTAWVFDNDGNLLQAGDLVVSFVFNTGVPPDIELYIWTSRATYDNISPQNFTFGNEFNESTIDPNWGYASINPPNTSNSACGKANNSLTAGPPWGTINSKGNYSMSYDRNQFVEFAVNLTAFGIDPTQINDYKTDKCSVPFGSGMFKSRTSASFSSQLKDFSGPVTFSESLLANVEAAPDTLTCTEPVVELSLNNPTPGLTVRWETTDGNIISSPDSTSIFVDAPGTYRYFLAVLEGCDENEYEVEVYDERLTITLEIDTDTIFACPTLPDNRLTAITNGDSIIWSGPNGFGSRDTVIFVNESGIYYLEAWDQETQCFVSDSVLVLRSPCTNPDSLSDFNFIAAVIDTIAPTFTVPDDITILCLEDYTDLGVTGDVLDEADNCDPAIGEAIHQDSIVDGGCGQSLHIFRTWHLTDHCNNTTEQIQEIHVVDTLKPFFIPPANLTISCEMDPDDLSITGNITENQDNCDGTEGVVAFRDSVRIICDNSLDIYRFWRVTDDCGNYTERMQIISVRDTTPPTFTIPGDTTLFCSPDTDTTALGSINNLQDNCGSATVDYFDTVDSSGACGSSRIIERHWVATDNCGNTNEQVQRIEIIDTIAPVILDFPNDTTLFCEAVPPLDTLAFSDECGQNVAIQIEEITTYGTCINESIITRRWTYSDACENSSSHEQRIQLENCLPDFSLSFSPANPLCVGEDVTIQINSVNSGLDNFYYQWEYRPNTNSPWRNLTVIQQTETLEIPNVQTFNNGFYRVKIALFREDINTPTCRFISAPIELEIYEPAPVTVIREMLCIGESKVFDGQTLTSSGTYFDTLAGAFGCDSLVRLELTFVDTWNSNQMIEICEGDSAIYKGQFFTVDTSFTDSLLAAAGCDSLHHVQIQIVDAIRDTLSVDLCLGSLWRNQIWTSDTVVVDSFLTNSGCDSLIYNQLNIHPAFELFDTITACVGETFQNILLENDTTITEDRMTQQGCDSTVHHHIIVHPLAEVSIDTVVCAGSFIAGTLIERDTSFQLFNDTQFGCDSTTFFNVFARTILTTNLDTVLCPGESFEMAGNNFSEPGFYIDTMASQFGCDSIIRLQLDIDSIAPTFMGPQDTTLFCDPTFDTVSLGSAFGYEDNFSPPRAITFFDIVDTACGTTLRIQRIWQAQDACNNQSEHIQEIQVIDTLAPVILNPPIDFNTSCAAVPPMEPLGYLDECNQEISPIMSADTVYGACINETLITRRWEYTDSCENTTVHEQVITVRNCLPDFFVSIHPSTPLCIGENVWLEVESTNSNIETFYYQWEFRADAGSDWQNFTLVRDSGVLVIPNIQLFNNGFYRVKIALEEADIHNLGCNFISDPVSIQVVAPPAITYIQATRCIGENFEFNGQDLTTSGQFFDTLTSHTGCDSIVSLELTFLNTFQTAEYHEICLNDSVAFKSTFFKQDTIIRDSLTAQGGCDSIHTFQVNIVDFKQDSTSYTVCQGTDWRGFTIMHDTLVIDTFTNITGCDSLHLHRISVQPEYYRTDTIQVCAGSMYRTTVLERDTTILIELTSTNGCDSLIERFFDIWPNSRIHLDTTVCLGNVLSNIPILNDTTIRVFDENVFGCDSVTILHVSVLEPTTTVIRQHICEGDQFELAGQFYDEPGIYSDTVDNRLGCDSILRLELFVDTIPITMVQQSICAGDSMWLYDAFVEEAGTYIDTLSGSRCDSIIITELSEILPDTAEQFISLCLGDTIFIDNQPFITDTIYRSETTGDNGCSHFTFYNIQTIDTRHTHIHHSLCAGDTIILHGKAYTDTGQYRDTLTNTEGCDSIVYLHLRVWPSFRPIDTVQICAGDQYFINNVWQSETGFYVDSLQTIQGCDSLVQTYLEVLPLDTSTLQHFICEGDSFDWHGLAFTRDTTWYDTLLNQYQCDSILIHKLNIRPFSDIQVVDTVVCEGDSLYLKGIGMVYETGEYQATLTDEYGCDSMLLYSVESVPQNFIPGQDFEICEGETIALEVETRGLPIEWAEDYWISCKTCADPELRPEKTITYHLEYPNGCYDRTEIARFNVEVFKNPTLQLSENQFTINEPDSLTIWILDYTPEWDYSWHIGDSIIFDSIEQTFYFEEAGSFFVQVENDFGCLVERQVNVDFHGICPNSILNATNVVFPVSNAFGNRFEIEYRNLIIQNIEIFNRWGQRVFQTDNPEVKWDATFRGQMVNPGVYMYMIEGECPTGKEFVRGGNITVIH